MSSFYNFEIKCLNCGAVTRVRDNSDEEIEYENNDIKIDATLYMQSNIKCSKCNNFIIGGSY